MYIFVETKSNRMKFNSQFSHFLERYKTQNVVKYKGFRVTADYRLKTFKSMKKERLILYNPQFFNRLTPNQIFFTLEWGIRSYRYNDVKKSYIKTKEYCSILGITDSEIDEYLTTITTFRNFDTEVYTPTYLKPIKFIQKKIKKWIHSLKNRLSGTMVLR